MNVLITGGCGYVGAVLIPFLLADGHKVTNIDCQLFGDGGLPKENGSLTNIKRDVMYADVVDNLTKQSVADAVIWLAGITNNDEIVKYKELAEAINRHALRIAMTNASKRFIYASSVAVYGTDYADEQTEPEATTAYGHDKLYCEQFVREAGGVIVRCASVCGESSNMRFDITANKLTHDAIMLGKMTVNGGRQMRSHVHIDDACDFYRMLLSAPMAQIGGQTFNCVGENQSVRSTALTVARELGKVEIEFSRSTDERSYSVSGDKARALLGWKPKRNVAQAVKDIKARFDLGKYKDTSLARYWRRLD